MIKLGTTRSFQLHVALHDPARVLREIEAKRLVLARHVLSPAASDPELPWDDRRGCQFEATPGHATTWSSYSEHPDFPPTSLRRHSCTPERMTGAHTPQVTPTTY
ncbi:DUF6221 family protein [Streptomyces sp. NPDC002888]|uniref:DUF6221 family protein n=1 Tax=Streptomyces sp. NPDC002888 TaxID=3364668 RepID=UPI003673EF43